MGRASDAKLRECARHLDAVDAVAFTPDGPRLATGGSDHALRIWDWRPCGNALSVPFAATVDRLEPGRRPAPR